MQKKQITMVELMETAAEMRCRAEVGQTWRGLRWLAHNRSEWLKLVYSYPLHGTERRSVAHGMVILIIRSKVKCRSHIIFFYLCVYACLLACVYTYCEQREMESQQLIHLEKKAQGCKELQMYQITHHNYEEQINEMYRACQKKRLNTEISVMWKISGQERQRKIQKDYVKS